jgi:hypothetical protein
MNKKEMADAWLVLAGDPPAGNWFAQTRQDWIAEMLHVYGHINRENLIRKFRISVPQAANDFRTFQQSRPGQMVYNPNAKRYERNGK